MSAVDLARGDDHEHLGVLAAVGDDAALGEVAHLAPEDELPGKHAAQRNQGERRSDLRIFQALFSYFCTKAAQERRGKRSHIPCADDTFLLKQGNVGSHEI